MPVANDQHFQFQLPEVTLLAKLDQVTTNFNFCPFKANPKMKGRVTILALLAAVIGSGAAQGLYMKKFGHFKLLRYHYRVVTTGCSGIVGLTLISAVPPSAWFCLGKEY